MSIKPLIYRSTDAGAPQLTGQAGSLVAVLDAVLVNGYGVGVDAKAPAGWTLEFSGTNKRVYRNSLALGTGTYLRVDDTGSEQLADTRLAWMRAYEAMSDVDTGTNPCPTAAQLGRGIQVLKSTVANATACPWVVVACERYAYLFVAHSATSAAGFAGVARVPYFFGDFDTNAVGDDFNFLLVGVHGQTYATSWTALGGMYSAVGLGSGLPASNVGWYALRSYQATAGAVPVGPTASSAYGSSGGVTWGGGGEVPNRVTGGLIFERGMLHEGQMLPRGAYPGLLVPLNRVPFDDLAVAPVLPGYEGRRFIAKSIYTDAGSVTATNNYVGQVLLEAYEHD